jgi:hypothetical protein
MPYHWRNRFQEIGKKARVEPFDELSSFFDFYHSSDSTNPSKADDKKGTANHRNNMKQQPHKTYPQNDDPCPLHNGLHKWIDCYDNKRGVSYPRHYCTLSRPIFSMNSRSTVFFVDCCFLQKSFLFIFLFNDQGNVLFWYRVCSFYLFQLFYVCKRLPLDYHYF